MNLKVIALFIGALTAISSIAQNVSFSGKITNPKGEEVYLREIVIEEGKSKPIDVGQARIEKDGSFLMKFQLDKTTELIFSDGNEQVVVLLSPGDEVHLTLNTKMFDETISYTGKGAAKNNAIIDSYMIEEVITDKVWSFEDDVDTTIIFEYIATSFGELRGVVKDYMRELEEFDLYGEEYYLKLEKLEKRLKSSVLSQRIFRERVKELVGTKALSITGVDLDGVSSSLEQYKGKTIIIDFWATWCGPCKAEMPAFKELETRYGSDVNFVSIGVFCKEDKWRKMAKELGFENNIFLDKEAGSQIKVWQVNFIPRYIVIDKNFKIVDANAPKPSTGDLEKLIKELNPGI